MYYRYTTNGYSNYLSSGSYYTTSTTATLSYWNGLAEAVSRPKPKPDPELEPSPELDEFIGLFRKKQTQEPEVLCASE